MYLYFVILSKPSVMSAYISPADSVSDESQLNKPLLTKLPNPIAYAEPYSPGHAEYIWAMIRDIIELASSSVATTRCRSSMIIGSKQWLTIRVILDHFLQTLISY